MMIKIENRKDAYSGITKDAYSGIIKDANIDKQFKMY